MATRSKVSLLLFIGSIAFGSSLKAQVRPNINGGDPTSTEIAAKKLYERLTGTRIPLDSPILVQMVAQLDKGDKLGAARIATADPDFYNTTVKAMALEMSTRNETVTTPLNDMVATIIGMTRDKIDARQMLTGNFHYRGSVPGVFVEPMPTQNIITSFMYSNEHYIYLDSHRIDLFKSLYRVDNQPLVADPALYLNVDPAGVLTSQTFMREHAVAGTNRRIVEYAFREFLCVPINQWADSGASDARVGQDINRFPGGDHNKYLTSCKACHSVMDGFRGAFAKWDSNGIFVSSDSASTGPSSIAFKYGRNQMVFQDGYETKDDSFVNYANRSTNATLFGWRGTNVASGKGAQGFGQLLANSRRFSQCMAKRVFKTVCKKSLPEAKEKSLLSTWGDEFEASGYQLKNLFEAISIKPECLG